MVTSFDVVNRFGVWLWKNFDTSALVMSMKGLACVLLLVYWWNSYQKSLREGKPKFDYWTLIYGVMYISVIVNCDKIIQVLDSAMVSVGNMLVGDFPMPDGDFSQFQDFAYLLDDTANDLPSEKSTWTKIGEVLSYIVSFDWIYDGLARACLLFTIITDYSYFLLREFLLVGAKLMMPIVLALAVIPSCREKAIRFLMVYVAIHLTGYLFVLCIGVSNAAFVYFIGPTSMILDGLTNGVGSGIPLLVPKLILFAACVKAKVQMFNGSIDLTKRLFA